MILVTGATGTVGRIAVAQLLAAGQQVRAMTRDPQRAALPAGVALVAGDLDRPESLSAAFDGAERVLLIAAAGPDGPAQDGRAAAAAVRAGASQVVELSALGADSAADPISRWHLDGERAVAASGLACTFLRPNGFMSNTLRWAPSIRASGRVAAPFAHARAAVIDPADIAAVAAAVLCDPLERHAGHAYPLAGPEALSAADQVAILAEALDRPIAIADLPPEAAVARMVAAGMAPEVAAGLMVRGSAGTPYDPTLHPTVEQLLGRPARGYRAWVAEHLDAFR